MRIAFPGMDPFLEQPAYWFDFHATFVNYWREAIADLLPPSYEAAIGERVIFQTVLEGPRETYIEILHQPDQTLVTALELLSPANKELPGRVEYLAKRRALLLQKVHLVELDLLLAGRRLPFNEPLPEAHYYYSIARAEQRPDGQVYHWTVRQPLSTLPVPLRQPDADIQIDLGAVFAMVYERAKFFRRVDYQQPIPTFVSEADRQWVEEIVSKFRR